MLPASLSAKWLPRDFVEASRTGGLLTVVAYVVMSTVFVMELRGFLTKSNRSLLMLDQDVNRREMQINVDFDMFGIECSNLAVMVIDQERNEPVLSYKRELSLRSIGGTSAGTVHSIKSSDSLESEEDEHERIMRQLEVQDGGKEELDADWAASHDGFKHKSFEHVVQYHDFTLINFFAGWCSHCQKFAPQWDDLANQLSGRTFADKEGNERKVTAIKMNCVDFQNQCRQQGINAFPTIRLYKADGTLSAFKGERTPAAIISWIELVVRTTAYGWGSHHSHLASGCSVRGFLRIPRVPGRLEFMAGAGDQDLHPEMTNVSHLLRHLSFKDPESKSGWKLWSGFPREITVMAHPIDGRQFVTEAPHTTWEHHLQLVSAVSSGGVAYQFTHHARRAPVATEVVPQVRFHFDFDPFAIQIVPDNRRWYDFVTSLLAALGGLFALFRLISRFLLASGRAFSGNSRNGTLVK